MEKGITVCLDQRLNNIDVGTFRNFPYALFYPDFAEPTLALFDTGDSKSTKGMFKHYSGTYSSQLIEKFFKSYGDGPFQQAESDNVKFGYTYTQKSGESTTRYYKWKDAENFNAFQTNDSIKVPPLRLQP